MQQALEEKERKREAKLEKIRIEEEAKQEK